MYPKIGAKEFVTFCSKKAHGLLFHANPASKARKVTDSLTPAKLYNENTCFFGFRPNSTGKVNLGTYPTAPIFGGKGSPGEKGGTLGANLLAKKLRNVRTGAKQGDFRVLSEKSRTVWRERPKRTRDQFVLYCLARARFASGRLAPNRKVTYCLARTFLGQNGT